MVGGGWGWGLRVFPSLILFKLLLWLINWHCTCASDCYGLDWHNFYTKSLSGEVTLGLKYKLVILVFGGASYRIISDADASVPDAHAQCKHRFLTRVLSMVRRDPFKFGIFLRIC